MLGNLQFSCLRLFNIFWITTDITLYILKILLFTYQFTNILFTITLREEIFAKGNSGGSVKLNLRELILADLEKIYIWQELILADSSNNLFFKKGFGRKKNESTLNGKKKLCM